MPDVKYKDGYNTWEAGALKCTECKHTWMSRLLDSEGKPIEETHRG